MGIFDFFKRKTACKFTEVTRNCEYNPWNGQNSNTDFSNVNFLNCVSGRTIGKSNDDYPRYCSYRYGIKNPIEKHNQMILDGFLEKGSVLDSLRKLKVQELKVILSQNGISATGKKEELIQKIIGNVPINKIDINYIYVLTDKGSDYVNKNNYYIEVSAFIDNGNITLEEFEEIKHKQPQMSANDIVWSIYNKKCMEYALNGDYGLVRNIELERHNILLSEGKNLDALYHILSVFYYDLSGMENNNHISSYDDIIHAAPSVEKSIYDLRDYYSESLIDRIYKKIYVPFRYFEKDIFIKIVNEIVNTGSSDIEKYKSYANKIKGAD